MTLHYLGPSEDDVGYDALLKKITVQEVCVIGTCIVCYGIPVLV